jgi:predicted tellurium resistance membrane protein TerC
MLMAAEPIIRLVVAYPSVKLAALTMLLLIGAILILEGFGANIPKWVIYTIVGALAVNAGVDIRARRRLPTPPG